MAEKDQISPVSTTPTCVALFSGSSTAAESACTVIKPPFQRCDQLCEDLDYPCEPEKSSHLRSRGAGQTLPDAPRVRLNSLSQIMSHCLEDLDTVELNHLGEKLWWSGSTPDVVSLSQQLVLERKIQVTECASVHLLWTEGVIYVKPLPAYLASFAFWQCLLDPSNAIDPDERKRLIATSLGFLKSYASIIQRRSDFNLARRHDLLASFEHTSFEKLIAFLSSFDAIPDKDISSRWRYGLIQLDPLNFYSAIFLRRWHLNRFESRYGAYFARFFPVVLFIFALLSVMLCAMQVILGARQLWDTDNKGLKKTLGLFVWTGTEAIAWSLAFGICFVVWWIGISSVEAFKRRAVRKQGKKRVKEERAGCP